MKSLKEIYKIGPGPSSSHTLAVQRACLLYKEHHADLKRVEVELFDSLAFTAEGHHTFEIIRSSFKDIEVSISKTLDKWRHPYATAFDINGYDEHNEHLSLWEVASIGGGSIRIIDHDFGFEDEIYPHQHFDEVKAFVTEHNMNLFEYVLHFEPNIVEYMEQIVNQMLTTVKTGLSASGLLPGRLKVPRVSNDLLMRANNTSDKPQRDRLNLMAYAYAASEENASGGICVTAPTLGASGSIAGLVYHYYHNLNFSKAKIIEGLCVGGIFANVIKTNATLAGSEGGCQAEIGSACAMASAMITHLNGANLKSIEYAAEIGIEHHLGLTCDPIGGYVIIPCIERNAVALLRSFDAALLAEQMSEIRTNKITFDSVVRTMNYTGKMIIKELRETSLGGLATEVVFDSED
ncbi:MAG: L-serine ammonia-lyase [Erysipelothrix sp.]|nr:L-serine ammonia-lyase [Erysipelothrix sp.]